MNKHVGLDEKLAVLQASDGYRKWYSLDDQRVCILCEKLINGRMIDIWQDHDGTYRLHCPTPGCSGTTRDWFYCGFRARQRPKIPQEAQNRSSASLSPANRFATNSGGYQDPESMTGRNQNRAY